MEQLEFDSSIPSLPYAIDALLDSLTDENMGFAELAETISHFPDIVSRLIVLANSAWASPTETIVDLQRVCARLGFSMVRSISIAMVISGAFNPERCKGFIPQRYWTTSLLAAQLIPVLISNSSLRPVTGLESIKTASLLHNIGILWLADNLPNETSQAFTAVHRDPNLSLREALQRYAGMDYCLVGGCLCRAWRFPDLLLLSLEHQANLEYRGDLQDEVHLVGAAARMVSSISVNDREPVIALLAKRIGVNAEQADAIYGFLDLQQGAAQGMARTLFS